MYITFVFILFFYHFYLTLFLTSEVDPEFDLVDPKKRTFFI